MRVLAVLCLILLCSVVTFLAVFTLPLPDSCCLVDLTMEGMTRSEDLALNEAFLLIDIIKNGNFRVNENNSEDHSCTLNKKLFEAGAIGNVRELYKQELYFQKDELFLTFGELGKLFEYAVQAIRPPYTEMIDVEEYRLAKNASGYVTAVKLQVDFKRYVSKLFLGAAGSAKLYIYAEMQTYIDSCGFLHCFSLFIKPLNADIDDKTVAYALKLLFKDADYNKIIFSIYENMITNLGIIGLKDKKGVAGISETGISFLTRTAY